MISDQVVINGKYELLALHRGLMEARFCDVANDLDVSPSPILARIHRDIVAALMSIDLEKKGNASSWENWLKIDEDRREWRIAIRRARELSRWRELSLTEREGYARELLSPFNITPWLIRKFVQMVDLAEGSQ
jgi:hypothetical protein